MGNYSFEINYTYSLEFTQYAPPSVAGWKFQSINELVISNEVKNFLGMPKYLGLIHESNPIDIGVLDLPEIYRPKIRQLIRYFFLERRDYLIDKSRGISSNRGKAKGSDIIYDLKDPQTLDNPFIYLWMDYFFSETQISQKEAKKLLKIRKKDFF